MPVTSSKFEKIKKLALRDVSRGLDVDTVRRLVAAKRRGSLPPAETKPQPQPEPEPVAAVAASPKMSCSPSARAAIASVRPSTVDMMTIQHMLDVIAETETVERQLRHKYGLK